MALPAPQTTRFAIRGPIARADLPGLCDRVCATLRESGAGVALCDVSGIEPDAVTVDALARLQLAARRHGCQVRLRRASSALRELVAFMGLRDVLLDDEFSSTRRSYELGQRPKEEKSMSRKLFVNLAVADLDRSIDFFTKLGFSFDPNFTDESATCMLVGEDAYFMLLVESRFKDFTKQALADPKTQTEAILALTAESREEVDQFADKALESGGAPANEPLDHGFMYTRSFHDPDGHHWEIFWMDPSATGQ